MEPGRQRLAPFVPPVAGCGDCKASFEARAVVPGVFKPTLTRLL